MTLGAGELRHRVSIKKLTLTQDQTTGEMTEAWSELAKAWAHVVPVSGKEFIAAQAEASKVTARIKMRYRTDLTHEMRIEHRGIVYNIEAISFDNESGSEWINVMCSEGVERNG